MLTEEENKVLELLAKEWDYTGPPGIMDISDIVSAVNLAPTETMETIKALFQSGLLDMNSLKTSVFLTPDGYECAKSKTH
jgi:hypothetical protein